VWGIRIKTEKAENPPPKEKIVKRGFNVNVY